MKTKPEYWYKQSAVIPYRIKNNNLEILVITSRRKKHWIIPKGIIEKTLSPSESAVKEVLEEAGVTLKNNELFVGTYKYKKWGGKCDVKVFAMEVENMLQNWNENFRDRKWISSNEIDKFIDNKKLLKVIIKFINFHNNFKNVNG